MLLKNISSYTESDSNNQEEDLMLDTRYVCSSCALITESLQKGCDVLQLANGDIIVTEIKPVTFQYSWDSKRGKLIRSQYVNKPKKTKPRKSRKNESIVEFEEELMA